MHAAPDTVVSESFDWASALPEPIHVAAMPSSTGGGASRRRHPPRRGRRGHPRQGGFTVQPKPDNKGGGNERGW